MSKSVISGGLGIYPDKDTAAAHAKEDRQTLHMQRANEHGVCEADTVVELARRDRAYASVKLCRCEDGLYRYALDMAYSYGGFCGPIFAKAIGFASPSAAKEAATQDLLRRFPKAWASEPQSVHDELRDLRAMIEVKFRQPSLF